MPILNDVAQLIMGQSPPSSTYNDTGEGLPFYQGKTDFGAIYPLPQKFCTHPKKIALPGDILISVRAPVGTTNLCREKSCIGRGIAAIRAEKINKYYLFYNLRYLENKIAVLGTGSTFKSINKSQLASVIVNNENFLIQEQKIIAGVLSLVQNAIAQQEKAIALTTELKKALMQKLFTEGTYKELQKQTEIGLIPESWDVVSLNSLLREKLRNGHSAKETNDENGVRTLTLTAVTRNDFSETNTKITCADKEKTKKLLLKSGDIFIERANTLEYVGLAALYEGKDDFAIFPDLLVRIRVNEKISPKVLANYLVSPYCRKYFSSNAKGTAGNFPKIDQGIIASTLVPLPSKQEQEEQEKIIRYLEKKLTCLTRVKDNLQDLFQTLLHQLMTAKIRVSELNLESLNLDLEEKD